MADGRDVYKPGKSKRKRINVDDEDDETVREQLIRAGQAIFGTPSSQSSTSQPSSSTSALSPFQSTSATARQERRKSEPGSTKGKNPLKEITDTILNQVQHLTQSNMDSPIQQKGK
ncbi:hypothetical protein I204_08553 [Kwoniella mangroviensis CBS 8886]|nr:hypothetical protein I204_08553 [Kwoniella mangroviensis CBS 8886]